MAVTDAQVRKLMKELRKDGNLSRSAMKSGMDRKTARKYADAELLPSEFPQRPRGWRTRRSPFEGDWPWVEEFLSGTPEVEAKALFEHLMEKNPEGYQPGHVRSFQRAVRRWRAMNGPDKEVFFAQQHRPGEAVQVDFTWGTELGISIAGEPFNHMLCHVVLPYSNWQWATVCRSESIAAIRGGIQAALLQLGRVPAYCQTDHSTAATHVLPDGGGRFNAAYVALLDHYGVKPRTTAVGAKEQNGDVEALNGALKRRLKQHLLLRGDRDFSTVAKYQRWLQSVLRQANALRDKRVEEELAAMRPIEVRPLPQCTIEKVRVTSWSTIRVKRNTYSVPSRLIGERVDVHVYAERLEVYCGGVRQETMERLVGEGGHRINYRHLIWSLVRKPAAFLRYRYREALFPTLTFRKAYDALCSAQISRHADISYLRILFLAATTMQVEVEVALGALLEHGQVPEYDAVKALVSPEEEPTSVPALPVPKVDLGAYDALLSATSAVGVA